jgi:hypothetical protein
VTVIFFDREDKNNSQNGTALDHSGKLTEILESVRGKSPFFCELVGENGYNLLLGIGTAGCAQYSRNDGSAPYLMAVDPTAKPADGYMQFLIGGTPTRISTRYALPFDLVKIVAADFLGTGGTSQAVQWEEV